MTLPHTIPVTSSASGQSDDGIRIRVSPGEHGTGMATLDPDLRVQAGNDEFFRCFAGSSAELAAGGASWAGGLS